ncbi:hypothetical protein AWB72_03711 [Caballeronia concitans]|uniref:Phosphate starvation-inducible protein PsiF n=2 Tax=Burkholderiaceae TaxID=119060 RepID=A0A658R0E9_9BURK|nr:hypothetical protein BurMR1_3533 [Burkholderia sp. MR1]SAL36972.1 hypothetical protein AWB72_03711 [Caballeronia concitans]
MLDVMKLIVPCVVIALLSANVAHADDAASAPAASEAKTLKERLGDKASDEQRVDNCKVPPDKRGAKIRPDACAQ